jgi:hypothetical protein
MYMKFFLLLILSSLQVADLAANDEAEIRQEHTQADSIIDGQASMIDLDELDRQTEDIIERSKTTPEDIAKEVHMPAWKGWVMKAGDFMYWTYQTGIETVQTLYDRCKKAVTGTHEAEKTDAA